MALQETTQQRLCDCPGAGRVRQKGPVLVYYSFEPYPNSRLEDFAVASHNDIRAGIPALAIGLPLLVLSCGGFAIHMRRSQRRLRLAGHRSNHPIGS